MDLYSLLHRTVSLPLWNLYQGQHYSRYYSQVASFCGLAHDEMWKRQWNDVKRIVRHAFGNIPYYRELAEAWTMDPVSISSFEEFLRIPVLTKSELRKDPDRFLDPEVDRDALIRSGTGGTTDSPIPIYYDRQRNDIKMAEMVYFRKWFGWQPESRIAYLWGAPMDIPSIDSWKYRIKNALFLRTLYLFASVINDEVLHGYVDKLNRFKPDIIQAYSNPMYLLSLYVIKNRMQVHTPKAVIVTAEPCYPSQREAIEKAFRCRVYSFYGARESGYIAAECSNQRNYHINSHGLYVEILKDGMPAEPEEIGDVVITDLKNFVMPLIRYKIGDMASISDRACDCGCSLPVMNFIAGRETDVFILPNGDMVPGVSLCDRVVEDCAGFAQLQFIQEEYDRLTVKIVKGRQYGDADMIGLDSILKEYFHDKLKIEKVFVDDIPKEKSGKTRFCISKVLYK